MSYCAHSLYMPDCVQCTHHLYIRYCMHIHFYVYCIPYLCTHPLYIFYPNTCYICMTAIQTQHLLYSHAKYSDTIFAIFICQLFRPNTCYVYITDKDGYERGCEDTNQLLPPNVSCYSCPRIPFISF